jgi:hypothetical protein
VRAQESLALDAARRAAGRGSYLHRSIDCVRRFAGAKGPVRGLRWTPPIAERTRFAAMAEQTIVQAR